MNAIKLDLGAGKASPPGFTPIGRDHPVLPRRLLRYVPDFILSWLGREVFPLRYPDESVDEIRASHVLEHLPYRQLQTVVTDWARCLKKGGKLKIAVPDFAKLAQGYLEGKKQPHESYIMGGQVDGNDFHKAMFDRDRLRALLAGAGLVLIQPWKSEIDDCAAYPISLNLEARKPYVAELKVSGCMSVPRLGFMDNMFSCMEATLACSVKLRMNGGAFWGQSLTKVFERAIAEDDPDFILAVDYDSIFTPGHLGRLIQTAMLNPDIDALAPIQSSRHDLTTLFTVKGADDANRAKLPRTALDGDTMPVSTAHFGLTLIRASKLKTLPKPWFHSIPSPAGDWGEGHVDEDINFWRKWESAGNTLHLANRVAIGHAELVARWPDINLGLHRQAITDYRREGVPPECWV